MKKRIGTYLMDCISTAGVEKIFGVPGDFNLAFLDDIVAHPDVEWVGNTNELNASYAADGYARMKGLSTLVTTFGVGELSAVNGIAGSYAERVPVLAITGAPTTAVESAGKYVHHSLGEGTFDDYRNMFKYITAAQGYITPENATTEIPRLINAALAEKRPVHMHLPIDTATTEIEVDAPYQLPEAQTEDVSDYVSAVQQQLEQAKQPVILTGHEINSFGLHEQLEQFVEKTHLPVAQLSLGKSAFNEESEYYMGVYDGEVAEDDLRQYVDGSDLILLIGAKLTDSATAGFSYQFDDANVVNLNHRNFKLGDRVSDEIALPDLLQGLLDIDYVADVSFPDHKAAYDDDYEINDEPLTQQTYFKLMQQFIQPNDVIIADQGTSFFGGYDLTLSANNKFIGQALWGSIGYTLPATLGTQIADPSRRSVLLIGEGSLQLTVQSIATMIRQDIKPVLFVINNDGYTVERKIHGEKEPYNDISMWDYQMLLAVFGGKDTVKVHDVQTSQDLKTAMDTINDDASHMHFVEVKMTKDDAPAKLNKIAKSFANQNK